MSAKITRENLIKIYEELDKRVENFINRELELFGKITCDEVQAEYYSRLQGVYGTLKSLVTEEQWEQIKRLIDEVEEERYEAGEYGPDYGITILAGAIEVEVNPDWK